MDELSKLKVFDFNASTFTDRTKEAYDFGRDSFAFSSPTNAHFLYLSRYKKFNALFCDLAVPNPAPAVLTLEYWNGTAWTATPFFVEDTNGFNRSGFIKWQAPSDWTSNTVNSSIGFFVRISIATSSSMTFNGINLVFSDDNDLKRRRFDIMDFLPQDQAGNSAASFILAHVSAREEILQRLNRDGRLKLQSSGKLDEVDQWDLHDIDQIRTASTYLALSYIFEALRDVKDDVYGKRAESYFSDFEKAMGVYLLSIDTNDDGEDTLDEDNSPGFEITLRR